MAEQPGQPRRCISIPRDSEVVEVIHAFETVVTICHENQLDIFIDKQAESPFVSY